MQKIKDLLRGKTRQLFLAGMGLLLVLRILLYLMESSYTGGVPAEPDTSANLKPSIERKSEIHTKVTGMTQRLKEFRASDYRFLASFNMFDPKMVLDAPRIEQRASQAFDEATAQFKQGNAERALQLVDEVLALRPGHAGAQKLRQDILARATKTAEAVTSGTATVPPASPSPAATPAAAATP